jgi:hypothetical protein
MDGNLLYVGSLVLIAVLAYISFQNNRIMTMLVLLAVGAYIIYSHESGVTLTKLREDAVESVDEALDNTSAKKKGFYKTTDEAKNSEEPQNKP